MSGAAREALPMDGPGSMADQVRPEDRAPAASILPDGRPSAVAATIAAAGTLPERRHQFGVYLSAAAGTVQPVLFAGLPGVRLS